MTGPSAVRNARYWAIALSILVLGAGLYTAVFTATVVYRTYTPVLSWDQWELVEHLMRADGTLSLSQLWARHGEHNIAIGRIAGFIDLHYFGARNVSLLIEIYLVQVSLAFVLIWMARRVGRVRGPALVTMAGFALYCVFCPNQMENFVWGFQIVFVLCGFAAVTSFAGLILHKATPAGDKRRWVSWWLMLSLAAAFVSQCSLVAGLLVWPILLVLSLSLRLAKRTQFLMAIAGAVASGLFFVGDDMKHPERFNTAAHNSASAAQYIATYFEHSWDFAASSYSPPAIALTWLTLLIVTAAALSAIWFMVRPPADDLFIRFLAACMLFALAAAAVTCMGRLYLGIAQAAASRYQAIAMLFWACLAALILAKSSQGRYRHLAILQIAIVILIAISVRGFPAIERTWTERQVYLAWGWAALAENPNNHEAAARLSAHPETLPQEIAYLRSHNLGPDPRAVIAPASRRRQWLQAPIPNWAGYRVVSRSRCLGYLDVIAPIPLNPGRMQALGWAWDTLAGKPPLKIVLTTPDGSVTGFGAIVIGRPDVQAFIPQITDPITGWRGDALAAHGEVEHAFAVLSDGKSLCEIGEHPVP